MIRLNKSWSIGEIANLFDLSPETLRYYEKIGILSITKNKTNGYRSYSYEDIVILMDILFFRQLDVPLKDIDEIIKTKNLEEIILLLKAKQQLLSRKMAEIQRQQAILAKVVVQYEDSLEKVAQFKLVSTPKFKFKIIGEHDEEDLFTLINHLKKIDKHPIHTVEYLLLMTKEDLAQNANFNSTKFGIFVDNADHRLVERLEESLDLNSLEEGEYLYTILATNYQIGANDTLVKGKAWLNDNHYHSTGPLYGHYMASCHSDGLDFYEVWIKAEKNI